MNMKASLEALTKDAAAWRATSHVLADAKGEVVGLRIPEYAFSFAGQSVASSYESVRAHVEEYLQKGTEETRKGAGALTEIRDDFASTDQREAAVYRGQWDPA